MKERRERERRRKTQRTKGFSFLHPCITVRRGKQNNGEGKKRKSKLKPVERDEDAEKKNKRQTQTSNRRKRVETNEHRHISHHAFYVVVASSFTFPGMFFSTLHAFLVALLLFKWNLIHLNSNQPRHAWGNSCMLCAQPGH